MTENTKPKKTPSLFISISCFIVMLLIIGVGKGIYNLPIQSLLLFSALYAGLVGHFHGYSWREMESGITKNLAESMPVMYIIITVGVVIGTWIYSGTVPLLIYYGLKLISPKLFLVTAFLIVAVVSVATGTAWGSTATAGVALMGIAAQMNIPLGMACGAVIAGGVFGDKLSPLSDTTNLAALVAGVPLFTHIRHMLWTTVPASCIGLVVWFIAGQRFGSDEAVAESMLAEHLASIYNLSIILLLPAVIILVGALMKQPTVPLMFFSSIVAIILGVTVNGFAFFDGIHAMLTGFNVEMVHMQSAAAALSDADVMSLLNRGGINSMLNIVTTIFCGYAFAGIVSEIGALKVILGVVEHAITSTGKLISVTVVGCILLTFTAGVATIPIIMIGFLLKDAFVDMGLKLQNLSRTLEDSSTMLLPLVPWGASGIFYLEVLGVPTSQYFIWTVPCYLCFVLAIFYGFTGIGIAREK